MLTDAPGTRLFTSRTITIARIFSLGLERRMARVSALGVVVIDPRTGGPPLTRWAVTRIRTEPSVKRLKIVSPVTSDRPETRPRPLPGSFQWTSTGARSRSKPRPLRVTTSRPPTPRLCSNQRRYPRLISTSYPVLRNRT